MAKGDIILITFPFTDLSGSKLRPSLVLADTREDVTVAFITSESKWREPTDVVLTPSPINGLKKLSLVRTTKLATLERGLIKGRMGKLSTTEATILDEQLKVVFQLN